MAEVAITVDGASSVVRTFGELFAAERTNTMGAIKTRTVLPVGGTERAGVPVLPPLGTIAVDLALELYGDPSTLPDELLLCHEAVPVSVNDDADRYASGDDGVVCRPLSSEPHLLQDLGRWARLDLQLSPRAQVARAALALQGRENGLSLHLRCWLQLAEQELAGSSSSPRLINVSVSDRLYDSQQALINATRLALQRLREHQDASSDDMVTFHALGSQLARLPDCSLAAAHWEEGVRRGWMDQPGRHPFRQWAPHLDGPDLRPFWDAKEVDLAGGR